MMELLVSIVIFGIVAVGFLAALVTGYGAVRVAQDKTAAQSLTRSTFEKVQSALFHDISTDNDLVTAADPYSVTVHADYVDSGLSMVDGPTQLKLVTVTISYAGSGEVIMETQAVKAQQ